jgi:hypothetical protein
MLYLTMALCARTLAHVDPTGLEVVVRLDLPVTLREQGGLDGGAVLRGPDVAVPVLAARRRLQGDISRQDLQLKYLMVRHLAAGSAIKNYLMPRHLAAESAIKNI